jgi:hypothetical protein
LFRVFINVVAIAFFATGCASPPKYDYVKEGASSHEKQNAISECSYQIKLNKTPVAEQGNLLKLCMQGKSYRYKQVS